MRISEHAGQAKVSTKAVSHYQQLGLVTAQRRPNGYREYDETHLRVLGAIRELTVIGIPAGRLARSPSVWRPDINAATSAQRPWPPAATASPKSTASSKV